MNYQETVNYLKSYKDLFYRLEWINNKIKGIKAIGYENDSIGPHKTLNDYLDVQRKLASEFGFHVIELYNIGFMDCSDPATSDYYLADGLHPKDNGNIVLGEHIAAELSLYFGQK